MSTCVSNLGGKHIRSQRDFTILIISLMVMLELDVIYRKKLRPTHFFKVKRCAIFGVAPYIRSSHTLHAAHWYFFTKVLIKNNIDVSRCHIPKNAPGRQNPLTVISAVGACLQVVLSNGMRENQPTTLALVLRAPQEPQL